MDTRDFFVILSTTNGGCTPLMAASSDDEDSPKFATFGTKSEAEKAANRSIPGKCLGMKFLKEAQAANNLILGRGYFHARLSPTQKIITKTCKLL